MSDDEKRKREEILARREKLKREEDDLIKKCNSLILGVKCKAIQDAQVAEREMMK